MHVKYAYERLEPDGTIEAKITQGIISFYE